MNKKLTRFMFVAGLALAAQPLVAEAWHGGGGYYRPGHFYGYGHSPHFYGHAWYGGHWYHGWYGGRPGWWWLIGGTWYLYPDVVYPYPDPNVVPLAALPAPGPAQNGQQYWYWCGSPAGYYPYVNSCTQPWQAVAPGVPAPSTAPSTSQAPGALPQAVPLPPQPPAAPVEAPAPTP